MTDFLDRKLALERPLPDDNGAGSAGPLVCKNTEPVGSSPAISWLWEHTGQPGYSEAPPPAGTTWNGFFWGTRKGNPQKNLHAPLCGALRTPVSRSSKKAQPPLHPSDSLTATPTSTALA